jgi:DNA-binding MarR family transcriptional regulator
VGNYGRELNSLMRAVEIVRAGDEYFSALQVQTLLAVAIQPGITMAELGQTVGMSQSSASRNVAALSKWHRLGKPGADLIEAIEDPRERRRKIMYLTLKGRTVVRKVVEAMTGEPALDFESPTAKEAWTR